jgi:HK97 family phage major capsid protein
MEQSTSEPLADGPESRGAASPADKEKTALEKRAFQKFLRQGERGLTEAEARALSVSASDAAGGYTVPPEDFKTTLLKNKDNLLWIRKFASVIRMQKAKKITLPRLAADPADADWTTELLVGSEDATMAFGQMEMNPVPLAKYIKISKTLLRESALNIEELVQSRLAYKTAVAEEKGFLTGNGSGAPLGVFYASASGISTGRDFAIANATSIVDADADIFKGVRYEIPEQYWPNLRWVINPTIMKELALLKDADDRWLLEPSFTGGTRDVIDGFPVHLSKYAPNTKTTGLYIACLGDFSNYQIVDELDFTIQVLTELFALTNQIGYVLRQEVDGKPAIEECFARVKMA